MISDEHYEICLPILQDPALHDEDKTDRLEEILREKTNLTGPSLDNVVLDALWRYRDRDRGNNETSPPPPIRQPILRRPSPAYPWRPSSGTPLSASPRLGVSPLAPPGFVPTTFGGRPKLPGIPSPSPFSSPRPSPRLALAQPASIPSSPSLRPYEFANEFVPPVAEPAFGEYPGETVDWLVDGDDAISLSSSVGTGNSSILNAAAPEFSSLFSSASPLLAGAAVTATAQAQQQSQQALAQPSDMTPYDMLRTILGASKTDDEIETALALNNYDLSATITSIVGFNEDDSPSGVTPEESRSVQAAAAAAAAKPFTVDPRPPTPVGGSQKSIICKFYLSAGQCLRADCRFSHDLGNHLCKSVLPPPQCLRVERREYKVEQYYAAILTSTTQILGHGQLPRRRYVHLLSRPRPAREQTRH